MPLTFVVALDRAAMAVCAPIIQAQYAFSINQMSIILTAFTWAYALFQLPGGILARRFGSRRVLALAGIWWSVFTFLLPHGEVFLGFVAVRVLLGIGQAADWPASIWMLQKWFPQRERSRANSLLLTGLFLGSFIGSPIIVWLASRWGWQSSFYVFGIIGGILAIGWYAVSRDDPASHTLTNAAEVALIHADRGEQTHGGASPGLRPFLGSIQVWAMGMQYAMLGLLNSFFAIWLPTYLIQARGFTLTQMGWLGALPWGAMIALVLVTGALNDRIITSWASRKWLAIGGFLSSAAALAIGALCTNDGLMIFWMCVSLGSLGVVQVQVWSGVQDLGGTHGAIVAGFTSACGNVTNAFGPIFTSLLITLGASWGATLVVLATAGILGAFCWLLIHPERQLSFDGAGRARIPV